MVNDSIKGERRKTHNMESAAVLTAIFVRRGSEIRDTSPKPFLSLRNMKIDSLR